MAFFANGPLACSAALLVLSGSLGCVTGHLIDAGQRYEKVARFESACVVGDHLFVEYTARLEASRGELVSEHLRVATVSLREVGTVPPPPVDTVTVEWVEGPENCLEIGASRVQRDGKPFALVIEDDRSDPITVYSGTFTRSTTALWIVPIFPLTVAADAVATIPLALLATPYLFFAE